MDANSLAEATGRPSLAQLTMDANDTYYSQDYSRIRTLARQRIGNACNR